jgi:signal transduction histidine kinase
MDPGVPPGSQLEQLVHELELIDASGAGLAVSSRIAREHDGWIGVVTQEGHGRPFTVHLPPLVPSAA